MTKTELKCLRLSATGWSDEKIGLHLELTASEVASVLSVVMLKLRAPNRLAGLAKASRLGLLTDDRRADQNGNTLTHK